MLQTRFSFLKYLLLKKVLREKKKQLNEHLSYTVSKNRALYSKLRSHWIYCNADFFFFQLHLINVWLRESTTYEFFLWYINAPTWLSLYTAYVSVCVLFCSAEHRILWFMTVSARFLSHGPGSLSRTVFMNIVHGCTKTYICVCPPLSPCFVLLFQVSQLLKWPYDSRYQKHRCNP